MRADYKTQRLVKSPFWAVLRKTTQNHQFFAVVEFCNRLVRFWPLFIATSLFATVNDPLRWELFSGYRNDRLQWHLQEGGSGTLTYNEMIRDINFWENGLNIRTIYRDLVFFMNGSVSAFGRGDVAQSYPDLSFASDTPQFQFNTSGWAADTSGYFGYAANLTADRTYKVILIPLFGYSAHFEWLKNSSSIPSLWESTNAVGATSYTMTSSLPNTLRAIWYGVFLGGGFQIEPGGRMIFSGGYTYHWLNTRFTAYYDYVDSLFNLALSSEDENVFSLKAKATNSIGQTGWLQLDYMISPFWRAGVGALIHYFGT